MKQISQARLTALEAKFGTQKALAKHLGVSTRFIRYLKSGERSSVRVSKQAEKEYKKASVEAGYKTVKQARPSRVTKFYREPVIKEVKATLAKDIIPKFKVSTGKRGRKYFISAIVVLPFMEGISGGVVIKGRHKTIIQTRFAALKTPAQFKKEAVNIQRKITNRVLKEYGVKPIQLKFFRNKKPVK